MPSDDSKRSVTVFTDVACGWSTIVFSRFYRARAELGWTGACTSTTSCSCSRT